MSKNLRVRVRCLMVAAGVLLGGAGVMRAETAVTPPPVVKVEKAALDELIYKDGDRVRGHFLRREGKTIVFESTRFGLLHVPEDSAEIVYAQPPKPPAALVAKAGAAGKPHAEEEEKPETATEHWPFAPLAVAEALKTLFGNWHGRFAFAAEMMQDGSQHQNGTLEGHLKRKWKRDEIEINARYDYAAVDDVPSTDMIKADASWRHDLPHQLFTTYRPTLEWNRAYFRSSEASDYVLLQQEFGAGVTLYDKETRKLRVGLSENLFDVWLTPTPVARHVGQNVESVFTEVEAKLPWRVTLTDRGVYYYSITDQSEGWENRFEVNKKLTETLTIGVRHEIRHNNPDVRAADYRRLRLLLGLDF